MTDLAIDEASHAYATSFSAFYSLDLATAKCTLIAQGDFPNSLSFVPKGTVDPSSEALVGYVGSTYVRIDPKTSSRSIRRRAALHDQRRGRQGHDDADRDPQLKGGGTFLTALKRPSP